MEDLLFALELAGITIFVNILFLWTKFGKNYKAFLIDRLKELASELNYEVINDKSNRTSSFSSNKITIGNDLYSEYTISKITALYFQILSIHTGNTTLNRAVHYIYQFGFYVSILFSIGILIEILGGDTGILTILTILVLGVAIVLLAVCGIFFLPYKKSLQGHSFGDPEIRQIYLSLYWYLPVICLNASIGSINHIKWLFSKD